MKKQLLIAAGAFLMTTGLAQAQIAIRIGPPRPIHEVRPAPRPGYYWRAGYHRWDGNRYVWTPGEYIAPPRPGAVWVDGRYEHRRDGYYWHEGYWR